MCLFLLGYQHFYKSSFFSFKQQPYGGPMTSQGQVSHAMMSQSQNVMVSQGQPIMSQQTSQQQQQFQQQQQQQQQVCVKIFCKC